MRDWGWIDTLLTAITLAVGALGKAAVDVLRAKNETRQIDAEAAATTSDAERELREELRTDVRDLRALVEAQSARLTEMAEERLGLKRALDIRDIEISTLKRRLERLERVSQEHAECPARIAALQLELDALRARVQEVSDVQTP